MRAASAGGGRSTRRSRSRDPPPGGGTAPSPRASPCGVRGRTRGSGARVSSEAVLFLGFVLREAAHPRVGPAAVRDGDREHDLVGARRVVEPHLHRVVVGAHERRVLEVERDVDRRAGAAELLGRGDDGLAPADRRAKGRAELRMKQRGGVLVFASLADDRGLAVGLGGATEGLRRLLREQRPELLPRVDEQRELLDELPGERVLDDGDRRDLAYGTPRGAAPAGQDLLHHGDELSDLHHRAQPSPTYASASISTSISGTTSRATATSVAAGRIAPK